MSDVDPQLFRDALARWASGVTVLTARDAHGPVGMTAASFSSLSLDPPLVLVCIDHGAFSHDGLVSAPGFAVHVLSFAQRELSDRFARRGEDKWGGLDTEDGPHGVPLLPLGTARLVCARHQTLDGGDHTILIGRVEVAEVTDAAPLLYWNRGYHEVGP